MAQLSIDADTHIIESQKIWDKVQSEEFRLRRPVLLRIPEGTNFGSRDAVWLVDGRLVPKPVGLGGYLLHTPSEATFETRRTDTATACRELTDVPGRLADMDRLGVDVQVVYPTFFLRPCADDPALEQALRDAYNSFMGEQSRASGGRIKWVMLPPVDEKRDLFRELDEARQEGAVGVFLRGVDIHGSAADPAYFPLFEVAESLGMPICIHSGIGSPVLSDLFKLEVTNGLPGLAVVIAFRDMITNRVPERFPTLRFGFIEAGTSWLPYVFAQIGRGRKAIAPGAGTFFEGATPESVELMREYNLYVTCLLDEDLPYIMREAPADRLLVGSDYGHVDASFEASLFDSLEAHADLDAETKRLLRYDNPARFYGLDGSDLASESTASLASERMS